MFVFKLYFKITRLPKKNAGARTSPRFYYGGFCSELQNLFSRNFTDLELRCPESSAGRDPGFSRPHGSRCCLIRRFPCRGLCPTFPVAPQDFLGRFV